MHHIDGDGVTPTDRLRVGMVLGRKLYPKTFWALKIISFIVTAHGVFLPL
jgi:hypothetical protein